MKSLSQKIGATALALAAALVITGHARAATVTATLDPQEISLGDSAQLTVTVSGAQDRPVVPSIDGLDITGVGQSTQIEIINGSMTANASSTYQVTPQREGTFTIPAIHAGNAASQPITLRVLKGSTSGLANNPANLPPPNLPQQPSAQNPNGPVILPPGNPAASNVNPASVPASRFGTIQITLPKKEFYVGELVPIQIKVYVPADVQGNITDLPQITSDGFTLNPLGTKPAQTEEVANGREYSVYTWQSALTGVKTGDFPFKLTMPMTVIVQQQMPQAGDADDIFNNFFRNAMSSMGTKKEISLQSSEETLKILPLPQENRPADFGGAVGQFEVESSASPTSVNVGDPVTLRLKITGSGNFDRVTSNMLAADAHWKTYSPKSNFEPSDNVGYSGTKTFEQPVIPNDLSVTAVPSVSFSYFNPETRQYVTRTAAPIAVTVTGSALPVPASTAMATASAPATPPPAPASDLRANRLDTGTFVSTLRPVYLSPWFIAGQGIPMLALLGGLAFIRRREHVLHPARVRATALQQAIQQQIAAMDDAMHSRQTDAFFIHARSALQQRLGHDWNISPDAITLADVEARLGSGLETVRPIFEMADQAKYSDLHFEEADLQQWRTAVVNQLEEKNK
jgi:hypothetical protein